MKGHFRRPFKVGATTTPDGGGRVTELLARPYLNLHFPELAGFRQPLAGELGATRELLEASRRAELEAQAAEEARLTDSGERGVHQEQPA